MKNFSESTMTTLAQTIQSRIGFGLFTVLGIDPEHTTLTRWYTSAPRNYRLGESWPLRNSGWQRRIFEQAGLVFCRNVDALRGMFADAADIEALGLGSAISVPVICGGKVVAVVNILDAAGRYEKQHAEQALMIVSAALADRPIEEPPENCDVA